MSAPSHKLKVLHIPYLASYVGVMNIVWMLACLQNKSDGAFLFRMAKGLWSNGIARADTHHCSQALSHYYQVRSLLPAVFPPWAVTALIINLDALDSS